NGGKLIEPTFLPRTVEEASKVAKQVVNEKTSDDMRYLYKLNGETGSGRNAAIKGYRVGGKTGTANKVVNGRYADNVRFNAFVASFPIEKPEYVVLTIIDEPKPAEG